MKRFTIIFILSFFAFSSLVKAQWPKNVTVLSPKSNVITKYKGNLGLGKVLSSLKWAESSQVACFPGTKNKHFDGKHVFYAMKLPAYSKLTIRVKPLNGKGDVNLYAMQYSASDFSTIPPNVTRVTTCEASYWYGAEKPEKVFLNSIKQDYNVLIGVAGPKSIDELAFELEIDLKTEEPLDNKIKPQEIKVVDLSVAKGKKFTLKGNIKNGVQIPLGWANSSQTACFPSTKNEFFRGNHVFYRVKLPTKTKMTVTCKPLANGKHINVYGMRLSSNDVTSVPPNIKTLVCEANYPYYMTDGTKARSIYFNALNNPYNILIGVAGAKDVFSGDFELTIELKDW